MKEIHFKINDNEQLELTAQNCIISQQHDNEARKFIFARPSSRIGQSLLLIFKPSTNKAFEINLGLGNEFILSSAITQYNTVQMQIAFITGDMIEHSNTLKLEFLKSLTRGNVLTIPPSYGLIEDKETLLQLIESESYGDYKINDNIFEVFLPIDPSKPKAGFYACADQSSVDSGGGSYIRLRKGMKPILVTNVMQVYLSVHGNENEAGELYPLQDYGINTLESFVDISNHTGYYNKPILFAFNESYMYFDTILKSISKSHCLNLIVDNLYTHDVSPMVHALRFDIHNKMEPNTHPDIRKLISDLTARVELLEA